MPDSLSPAAMPDPAACWRAVAGRDRSAVGRFVYAVSSTGIFCRPDCPSRRPLRAHVRFFADAPAARAAGFRPCRRCQPERGAESDPGPAAVRDACAAIAAAEAAPTLAELARRAGYSAHHFHRLFRRETGITPRGYWAAVRARRLRAELRAAPGAVPDVADAAYAAGFGAASRAYQGAAETLGMTPAQFARGAPGERILYAIGRSALGSMLVAATARGVCAIQFGKDRPGLLAALAAEFPKAELAEDRAALAPLIAEVGAAVSAPGRALTVPLDIRGTDFQRKVWQVLRTIPAGQTRSYAAVAAALGDARASRAVARACATNRLAVAIPCHRVVRADGAAGGYRWGAGRKRKLLATERSAAKKAGETAS
ncbi:MAG: bifunctional DNA-binding transcriptional regulator/O6-methylguanine-DNA methyltransferase Ada [Alphaproteobacteria bacterium]|nr:bifunctional DNA-binding transcriptional regulator/O6-methylguanine-DNA methyltransferase Ada [Alphaproteobacteria bacterium]